MIPEIMTKIMRKDGDLIDIGASMSVLKDGKSKTIGFIGIFNISIFQNLSFNTSQGMFIRRRNGKRKAR